MLNVGTLETANALTCFFFLQLTKLSRENTQYPIDN